jgi:hypothetical protein
VPGWKPTMSPALAASLLDTDTSSNPACPDLTGQVRATRQGSGDGRTYTLQYRGWDKAGNSATCDVTVVVPHDQGRR